MSKSRVLPVRSAGLTQALMCLVSLSLLTLLHTTAGAQSSITAKSGTDTWKVSSNGGGWLPHKPTATDVIKWVWGSNIADGAPFPQGSATETKFNFPPPGDPVGKTYVGMNHVDTGSLTSTAKSLGSGSSAIATGIFWNSYKVNWTITARGNAVPGGNYTALAEADDPIALKPAELPVPSTPIDLWIPISIGPMTRGAAGSTGWHVYLNTTGGSTELLEVQFGSDGFKVTASTPGVSLFRLDSLTQADYNPIPTGIPMTAADLHAAVAAAMVGSDLPVELTVGVMVSGFVVPATTLADGAAIDLHIDSWAQDAGALPTFTLTPVTGVMTPPGGGGLFAVPERAPEVDLIFLPDGPPMGPGSHNGNVSLYGQAASGSWSYLGTWDWNPGTVHAFVPPAGMRLLDLVPCANSDPVRGMINFPVTTLSTPPLVFPVGVDPSFALGGLDLTYNPFNPTLGLGGGLPPTINLFPGLPLGAVPQYVGANHWQYLPLQVNFQPDPSRPWLYVGGNPANPLAGNTYLELHLDGLFDPSGNLIGTLPLQIDFQQGALHVPFSTQAVRDSKGNIQVPTLDLGQLLAQPYTLSIGVPAAPSAPTGGRIESAQGPGVSPGYISLRAVSVVSAPFGTAGVGARVSAQPFRITGAGPNPFSAGTRIGFELGARSEVHAEVLDASGRRVCSLPSGTLEAGSHELRWDGRGSDGSTAPDGIYFARLSVGGSVQTRKLARVH